VERWFPYPPDSLGLLGDVLHAPDAPALLEQLRG
jgi:hypothetical protein